MAQEIIRAKDELRRMQGEVTSLKVTVSQGTLRLEETLKEEEQRKMGQMEVEQRLRQELSDLSARLEEAEREKVNFFNKEVTPRLPHKLKEYKKSECFCYVTSNFFLNFPCPSALTFNMWRKRGVAF